MCDSNLTRSKRLLREIIISRPSGGKMTSKGYRHEKKQDLEIEFEIDMDLIA